jgi:DNA polymerase-3 subunit delta
VAVFKSSILNDFDIFSENRIKGFLVHGSDEGGVRDLVRSLIKNTLGTFDDPFRLTQFVDDDFKTDSALLSDELQSIPFGGDRKLIWVRDGGDQLFKAMHNLEDRVFCNFLIVEAGQLTKSNKLRNFFEKANHLGSIPVYSDSARDLSLLISDMMRSEAKQLSVDVQNLLVSLIGSDRAASRSEIEKLILYVGSRKEITSADVLDICGDFSSINIDQLCDSVFSGDLIKADALLERLLEDPSEAFVVLSSLLRHAIRLQTLLLAVEQGSSVDIAIKSARPPIFFSRTGTISDQLRLWNSVDLSDVVQSVANAIKQTRQLPSIELVTIGRLSLAISRRAQNLKSRN